MADDESRLDMDWSLGIHDGAKQERVFDITWHSHNTSEDLGTDSVMCRSDTDILESITSGMAIESCFGCGDVENSSDAGITGGAYCGLIIDWAREMKKIDSVTRFDIGGSKDTCSRRLKSLGRYFVESLKKTTRWSDVKDNLLEVETNGQGSDMMMPICNDMRMRCILDENLKCYVDVKFANPGDADAKLGGDISLEDTARRWKFDQTDESLDEYGWLKLYISHVTVMTAREGSRAMITIGSGNLNAGSEEDEGSDTGADKIGCSVRVLGPDVEAVENSGMKVLAEIISGTAESSGTNILAEIIAVLKMTV